MATNGPEGRGRIGAVCDRSQVHNVRIERWIKRNTGNGQFMDHEG